MNLDSSFEELQELYNARGITDAILDGLQAKIAAATAAKEKDKVAKQSSGEVVAMDHYSDVDTHVKVAAATLCEWQLLHSFAKAEAPRRPEVVAVVRPLRTYQVKEKDVLHPALFAKAYSFLTPKRV